MIRNVQFTRCKWFTIYQRGFTLLELLIVMVILGLFASIAVIISVNSNQNVKINTAVQDIRASLYSARSQAQSLVSTRCGTNLFTGVQVVFCNAKDKTGTSCLTTQCQNNGSPDYEIDLVCNNSVTATLEEKSLPAVISVTPDTCSILFQPFTNPIGSGNITISGYNKTKSIFVNVNGVIQ